MQSGSAVSFEGNKVFTIFMTNQQLMRLIVLLTIKN